jgi:hypothetical protein
MRATPKEQAAQFAAIIAANPLHAGSAYYVVSLVWWGDLGNVSNEGWSAEEL